MVQGTIRAVGRPTTTSRGLVQRLAVVLSAGADSTSRSGTDAQLSVPLSWTTDHRQPTPPPRLPSTARKKIQIKKHGTESLWLTVADSASGGGGERAPPGPSAALYPVSDPHLCDVALPPVGYAMPGGGLGGVDPSLGAAWPRSAAPVWLSRTARPARPVRPPPPQSRPPALVPEPPTAGGVA